MPITITPFGPSGFVGPGLGIELQSDFIGPLSSDAGWQWNYLGSDNEVILMSVSTKNNANPVILQPYVDEGLFVESGLAGQAEGTDTHVHARLLDPWPLGDELDTGTATLTWSPTAGLSAQIASQNATGKGLTDAQSTALANIDSRTTAVLGDEAPTITDAEGAHPFTIGELFTGKALDQLTLTEVSPGPTSDPVTSDVSTFLFGVIVRITSVPDWMQPLTPAQDWYPPDLAVLRVFRGTDVEERFGIHTASFMHPFHGLYGGVVLNETLLFGVPPLTSIEVEFAFGVAGRVYLMRFP